MIRLIAVIALCVSALFLYLALGNSAGSSGGATVEGLKNRYDAIANEAQQRLERDFNGEYEAVIALYQAKVADNPEFAYTVFPEHARQAIVAIEKRAERLKPAIVSPERSPLAVPSPAPARFVPPRKEAPVRTVPEGTRETFLEARPPASEEQAAILYNQAICLFSEEEYSKALTLLAQLNIKYAATQFLRKHQPAIDDYAARAGLLKEYPDLNLYYYETFDQGKARWEGRLSDEGSRDSAGALEAIRSGLKQAGTAHTRISLAAKAGEALFPLEKGQHLNFCIRLSLPLNVHIQLWDRRNKQDYYYDCADLPTGSWQAVSLPLRSFRSLKDPLEAAGDLNGECGYFSLSINDPDDKAVMRVDEISITGPVIPGYITDLIKAREKTGSGMVADLTTDHFVFNAAVVKACRQRLNTEARKGSILIAGDFLSEWVHTGIPATGGRQLADSHVKGRQKHCHEIAAHLPAVLSRKQPEVILILAGMTDLLHPEAARPPALAMETIINACIKAGSVPILCGLPEIRDPALNRRGTDFNASLLKYARTYHVPYIDMPGIFAAEPEIYCKGTYSLTARGKGRLSEVFRNLYRKIETYITSPGKLE